MKRLRARNQKGWLVETATGEYQAHWYEYVLNPETGSRMRRHRSEIIGTTRKMRKCDAEKILHNKTAPVNASVTARHDGRITFSWFLDNKFIPAHQANWSAATKSHNLEDFNRYIRPVFGQQSLDAIDISALQIFLGDLAVRRNLSESVVTRCKTKVSSVLEYAHELEFIRRNPARSKFYRMPACKATKRPVLSKFEMGLLWKTLSDTRDRLVIMVATCCALTASEVFGLTWECVHADHLIIRSSAYMGNISEWRVKRKARFRSVPITPTINRQFESWRNATEASGPVFPNKAGDGVLWSGVFLQKRIQTVARSGGIKTPVTFQVLRRSFATWNKHHLKDAQSVMGHSDIGTTGNVYAQDVNEDAADLVSQYEKEIMAAKPERAMVAKAAMKQARALSGRIQ